MKEKLNEWLEDKRIALIKSYEQEGLKASGRWAKSLEVSIEDKGHQLIARIKGEHYTRQMVSGRGPTKSGGGGAPTLRQEIREWIDNKNINPVGISKDSLAFLIARKIHKFGIRVPNKYNDGQFINRVFTDKEINGLKLIVSRHLQTLVNTEIIKAIKL